LKSNKQKRSISGRLILLINLALAFVTLLSFLTPFINPRFYWVFSVIGLFFPVYMLMHVFFILFWLAKEWKKALISVFCMIFGIQHIQNYIGFNSPVQIIDEKTNIRMATYNIGYGYYLIEKEKVNKEANLEKVKEELQQLKDVDIICFQEVGKYIIDVLKKSFPKHYFYKTDKGVVIVSRYPFGNKGVIDLGGFTNSCIWADVKIKGNTVRVYNFHLQSNKVSQKADEIVENLHKNENIKWYQDIKGILRKYRNTNISRAKQIDKIVDHIRECPDPYLIGTDMNDVPISYIYRQVSKVSTDAFPQKGRGFGTTYAGNIPFLRIDYIFYSKPFQCVQYETIRNKVSDHHPVVATLSHNFEKE
jgi:endonuclease/exonuclease/phosphatase family metal-dependent hydrolase